MKINTKKMITEYSKIVKGLKPVIMKGIVDEINNHIINNTLKNQTDDYLIKMSFLYSIIVSKIILHPDRENNMRELFNEVERKGHIYTDKQI